MVKKTLTTIALGTCVALSSSPILAQTTLNVSTWLPPSHVQNRVVWPTWAEWVEEARSEEHTSELQSRGHLVCRLLLEKKKEPGHASDRHASVLKCARI